MTRAQVRFYLALIVLAIDALLMAALVVLAVLGRQVSGENILFMAVGLVLGWGGLVVSFYFGTSESSAQKNEIMDKMAEGPTGYPGDPVHVEEEG